MLCIFNIHELCIATVREYNMLSDSKQELSIRVFWVSTIISLNGLSLHAKYQQNTV